MKSLINTLAVTSICLAANAATWYVAENGDDVNNDGKSSDAPFATIQKGIDSASNYDTVEIADGTYAITTPLTLDGKAIELKSASEDPSKVIVDAQRRCVCVSNGTTTCNNIINSITFQNGYSSEGEKLAGGIFSLSKTLVTNCVVRNCYHETSSTNAYGGGVCIENPNSATSLASDWPEGRRFLASLVDTLVEGCAVCCQGGTKQNVGGGGLSLRNVNGTRLTVRHCAVTNCSTSAAIWTQTCGGGGIFTSGTFTNCVFDGCVAMDTNADSAWRGSGGGLYLEGNDSNPCTVQDSLLINNWAMSFGGAIASASKYIDILGCTITNNLVGNPKTPGNNLPGGGGLAFNYSENIRIEDCLIANNDTTADPGGLFCGGGIVAAYGDVSVSGCVIRDNVSGTAGAFNLVGPKDVVITNCVIEGNVCTQQYSVARIYSANSSADDGVSFVDCLVLSNKNERAAANGRPMFYYGTVDHKTDVRYIVPFVLRNCFLAGNSENCKNGTDGWGVRVEITSKQQNRPGDVRPIVIDHCTFATNFNNSNGSKLIAMDARACANTLVKGCVLYGNRWGSGSSKALAGFGAADTAAVAIANTFCEVEGNGFEVTAENGNLSSGDLKFRDAAALDFRPAAGSCLIDRGGAFEDWMGNGNSTSISRDMGDGHYALETVGKYGVKVVRSGTNPRRHGKASDMGCFEYWTPLGFLIYFR